MFKGGKEKRMGGEGDGENGRGEEGVPTLIFVANEHWVNLFSPG